MSLALGVLVSGKILLCRCAVCVCLRDKVSTLPSGFRATKIGLSLSIPILFHFEYQAMRPSLLQRRETRAPPQQVASNQDSKTKTSYNTTTCT
jgi:hypothetical protein